MFGLPINKARIFSANQSSMNLLTFFTSRPNTQLDIPHAKVVRNVIDMVVAESLRFSNNFASCRTCGITPAGSD